MSVNSVLHALAPTPYTSCSPMPETGEVVCFDPAGQGMFLLEIIAWCVSAIGVGGVIVVGIQMAIQMQRGVPGEGASYGRGLAIVLFSCVLASTAGPIIQFLGPFNLQ